MVTYEGVCGVVQVTATNVDIAAVNPDYHLYTVEEVDSVIARL
jgi:hypothetical protein